eukprot:6822021-Prymnesium_polylepis.2
MRGLDDVMHDATPPHLTSGCTIPPGLAQAWLILCERRTISLRAAHAPLGLVRPCPGAAAAVSEAEAAVTTHLALPAALQVLRRPLEVPNSWQQASRATVTGRGSAGRIFSPRRCGPSETYTPSSGSQRRSAESAASVGGMHWIQSMRTGRFAAPQTSGTTSTAHVTRISGGSDSCITARRDLLSSTSRASRASTSDCRACSASTSDRCASKSSAKAKACDTAP